jgi:succinyl-CoA synthetase alpha subunit
VAAKVEALTGAGAKVAERPSQVGKLLKELMEAR